MNVQCPTYAEIQIVRCEDGSSLMAYAYPDHNTEHGAIVLSLDDMPPAAFRLPDHLERD